MNRIVVSFAAALMLGGAPAVMAQQGKDGGRPDAAAPSQAAPPGQAQRGGGDRAGPSAQNAPSATPSRERASPQGEARGASSRSSIDKA